MNLPAPSGAVTLPDGRRVAYDDVGDPGGKPVFYLHGCPDCRLTRHPDDTIAAEVGARVIAIDRPGYGASDPCVEGDDAALARDVVAVADALGVDRFSVLGWSSGGPGALALGACHPDRVACVGVAAGQVPLEADADPDVFNALDPIMGLRSELMDSMSPGDFAVMAAPMVAPEGMSYELALEYVTEGKDEEYLAELASVDGLHEQLALAAVAAVACGLGGVERDLRAMVSPWPFLLSAVASPVLLWYGTHDALLGPSAGRWLAERVPGARLEIVEGTHLLALSRWRDLVGALASYV